MPRTRRVEAGRHAGSVGTLPLSILGSMYPVARRTPTYYRNAQFTAHRSFYTNFSRIICGNLCGLVSPPTFAPGCAFLRYLILRYALEHLHPCLYRGVQIIFQRSIDTPSCAASKCFLIGFELFQEQWIDCHHTSAISAPTVYSCHIPRARSLAHTLSRGKVEVDAMVTFHRCSSQ